MSDRPDDAGHGVLFKNTKKEKPSHPDYQGDCTIKGRKLSMAAWIRMDKNGAKYMSIAFREAVAEEKKPVAKAPTLEEELF